MRCGPGARGRLGHGRAEALRRERRPGGGANSFEPAKSLKIISMISHDHPLATGGDLGCSEQWCQHGFRDSDLRLAAAFPAKVCDIHVSLDVTGCYRYNSS